MIGNALIDCLPVVSVVRMVIMDGLPLVNWLIDCPGCGWYEDGLNDWLTDWLIDWLIV